jgi:hypothetical protein
MTPPSPRTSGEAATQGGLVVDGGRMDAWWPSYEEEQR